MQIFIGLFIKANNINVVNIMIIFGIPLCDITKSFCMEGSVLTETSLLNFNAEVLQIEKSCNVHSKLLNSTIHYVIS